ncbi:MAG: glycoside hydrolase family 38 C-terminal domain-containing protein, partial [Gemmatimonadales bacterium]
RGGGGGGGGRDRRAVLDVAWRALVQCQFHDAIAGCCADPVARALDTRLDEVEGYAGEVTREALHDLVGHDPDAAREPGAEQQPTLVLWNPAARARSGVVIADLTWFRRDVVVGPPIPGGREVREAPAPGRFALAGPDGEPIPVQVLDARPGQERLDAMRRYPDQDEVDVVRVTFRAPAVPGLGAVALTPAPPPGSGTRASLVHGDRASAAGRTLANRFVKVTLEPSGALTLTDRLSGERFRDLLRLESQGDEGDTYTFCPTPSGGIVRNERSARVRPLARGPLVAAIEATYALRGGGDVEGKRKRRGRIAVRLVVMLHTDSPVVRCILEIDNQAADQRLRARVPTGVAGVPAVAGTQLGVVSRPAMVVDPADYPLEAPVPTAPAQRFVAVAAGRRGLALLAPGFFEYELTPGGDLVFTLLRAIGELSRGDLPTRPGHAGWPTPTPLAQCAGRDRIELAVIPLADAAARRGDVLMQRWEEVFLPLRGAWLRDAVAVRPAPAGITLEGAGLVLSTVKPARAGTGGGMILRCYNATSERTTGAWRFTDGARAAHRVRADERESTSLPLEDRGRTLRFEAGPHEIVTTLIT